MAILKPQPLATGVAYKKPVCGCNCQINYTLLYKSKLCQSKDTETGKKSEEIKKTVRVENSNRKLR